MLTISAINGEYKLKSLSGGTYHELTLVTKGTISADISIQVRREAADVFEQYSNYTVRTPTTFMITGSVLEIKLVVTNSVGSGSIVVELVSKDEGLPDTFTRGRAYVQSIARVFVAGVSLTTQGRPNINFIEIQNRDSQAIFFWHGLVPTDVTQVAYLPIDVTTWTAQQKLDAATFIATYGEKIDAGARYAPRCAQTGPLYSYVAANTAVAHVMVG